MKYLFAVSICLFLSFSSFALAQNQQLGNQNNSVTQQGQTAQGGANGQGVQIQNPLNVNSIADLLATILQVLLIFMVPVIVFFIIYAGFLYVTARGNVEQISQAHRAILYALIGGLLILGGQLLINVLTGTVNAVIK